LARVYSCSSIVIGHWRAHMPTLSEQLTAYFGRPETAEQLKQLDEAIVAVRDALIAARIVFESLFSGMALMAATIAQRAEENFPSKAYGQYLKDRGADPAWAQSLASLTISLGTRTANESRQLADVVAALRFLAQGNRRKGAILSRARVLLAARDETSILDEIFRKAGLNGTELSELVCLLKGAANGAPLERDRIREIVAEVAPSLPSARGRKVSAASAAHEQFLEMVERWIGPRAYTYSACEDDFVDEQTNATRLEFGDPHFDPRPACQRLAARRKARSN
jgi:hypothetical protein